MIAFLGLAIAPLLLVGSILVWQNFRVQQSQALELQSEVTERASEQVVSFISGLERELRLVVHAQDLTDLDRDMPLTTDLPSLRDPGTGHTSRRWPDAVVLGRPGESCSPQGEV